MGEAEREREKESRQAAKPYCCSGSPGGLTLGLLANFGDRHFLRVELTDSLHLSWRLGGLAASPHRRRLQKER
jgi:hypothetical protein